MPEEQDPNYDVTEPAKAAREHRIRKELAQRDKDMERIKRAVLCGMTAVVTWKFANGRARRQAAKTAYVLGRQAGEREAQLEVMILDHVRFLEQFDMMPLFKKVRGYSVVIDSE